MKFNFLTVTCDQSFFDSAKAIQKITCMCDCGKSHLVEKRRLVSGKIKSCGCFRKIATRKANATHSKGQTKIYARWNQMMQRCNNPKNIKFSNYGGRGIKVCDEWSKSFDAFEEWAKSSGFNESLEIDRINNDGGYSPENCRWITHKENSRNRGNMKISKDIADKIRSLDLSGPKIGQMFGIDKSTVSKIKRNLIWS